MMKSALNDQDLNGHTGLHISSFIGDFKAVRLFLQKGSESKLRDNKNRTALDLADNK